MDSKQPEIKKGDTLYELSMIGYKYHTVEKVTVVGIGSKQIHVAGKSRITSKHGITQIDTEDGFFCRLFRTPLRALRFAFKLNAKTLKRIQEQQGKLQTTIDRIESQGKQDKLKEQEPANDRI